MIKKFANKLANNRARFTATETGFKLEERRRDEDDNLQWVEVAVTNADILDNLISAASFRETELHNELREQRAAITNLQDIKAALYPSLKKK